MPRAGAGKPSSSGSSSTPSTRGGRGPTECPARSGEIVRKSSATRPDASREPKSVGPPSERISEWPRSRRQATARRRSTRSPSLTATTSLVGRHASRADRPRPARSSGRSRALERRMGWIERPARRDERDRRMLGSSAAATQLGERVGRRRDRPARAARFPSAMRASSLTRRAQRPRMRGAAPSRSGPLRSRPRSARSSAGDPESRRRRRSSRRSSRRRTARRSRARRRRAPAAAPVDRAPAGQVVRREARAVSAAAHELRRETRRAARRRSSYTPRQKVVTVRDPSSATPRICVHRCAASRRTATPRGWTSSTSVSAICSPRRSCTVKRRA